MVRTLVFAGAIMCASPAFGQAQEAAAPDAQAPRSELDDEAKARFEAGELAYAAGRFEAALADFRQAHQLSGRDELLYNIGLAAERLRRDEEAIDAFELFLEAAPDHPRADSIRQRLVLLREEIRVREQASTNAPRSTPSTPSRVGPIALAIGGAVVAAVGGVLLGLALAERNEVENSVEVVSWGDVQDTVDVVPRRSAVGIAMLAVGGGAMLGSLLWRLATPKSADSASAGLSITPGGVSLSGHF